MVTEFLRWLVKTPNAWRRVKIAVFLVAVIAAVFLALSSIEVKIYGPPNSYLDSGTATDFVEELRRKVQDPQNRALAEAIPEQASFCDLMNEFTRKGLLDEEMCVELAGASGTAADRGKQIPLTAQSCAFTGPCRSDVFLRGLGKSDPKTFGVVMTLNLTYFARALEYEVPRIPVLFGGEEKCQYLTLEEIEDYFETRGVKRPDLVGKPPLEIFGRFPFHNISPY
ncbi:MAG: hypothetical protein KDB07_07995 [Planctomycetes bacterium]|nr:hypothetical protein [Planctomycetota bacterium]